MTLSTMESEEIIRMPDSNFIDYVKLLVKTTRDKTNIIH